MHVVIVISASAAGETASPANFAIRSGGTVRVTIRNTTRLFHTFTVHALGINVLVRPLRSTSVTFVAPKGIYEWRCVLCASSAHPHMHAMRGKVYAIVNA
jgi:heme/copper-type cytochrome/quinol oxidase subunit 2